jgi:aryl-alcohol dehydrogenase-like predicted oxidoreductase
MGVTASGPDQAETIRRALDVRLDGVPLFSAVQATWNVLERSAGQALREAHQAGRSVLVKEALANGLLAQADGPLAPMARRLRTTPDALAIAFVAKEPWADVVLLGAATPAQIDSNLRALELPLSQEDARELEGLVQPAGEYWSRRGRMPWT